MRPYGLSKCLAEDLCAGFTARTGIPTVSLRPAWALDPGMYQRIEERWRADPSAEWTPTWEYGQFVDVRDIADAVRRALEVPLEGHQRVLLCAADIAATEASLVMAGRFARSVPVRDAARFEQEPRRSLFDHSAAARVLGWEPRYQWSTRGRDQAG
jgi:nucleoside-diphosphate-sugar epimerase